jgi:hypothetical protein
VLDFFLVFIIECQGPNFSFIPNRKSEGKVKLLGEESGLVARDYVDGPSNGTTANLDSSQYGTFSEQDDEDSRTCPADHANFFSLLTYSWLNPLLELGKSKPLEESDLYRLRDEDQAEQLSKVLQINWEKQLKKKKPSVLLALFWSYWNPTLLAGAIKLLADVLQFLQPQLLKLLLEFVKSYSIGQPQPPVRHFCSVRIESQLLMLDLP